MTSGFLMGLDAGGGGGRCLLVDVESGAVTTAAEAWSHPAAPGTEGWGLDLDHAAIWRLLGRAARRAMNEAGAAPEQVLGVAATSMRHGMLLLDGDGSVLWAVPNRDARAAGQALEMAGARGREFHRRTGHWPSPIAAAARLFWLTENEPALLERTRSVLSVSDWLTYRLCGEVAAEPSQAAETSLFDLATGAWAADLIESMGLSPSLFPELRPAGTRVGELTAEAAEALGLMVGIPVAVGGADTQCGLLGCGAIEPGAVGVVGGTTVPVQQVVDRPLVDEAMRLWTGRHVLDGRFVIESSVGAAGQALEWLGRLLLPGDTRAVARLLAEAAGSSPGAGGMLSSLGAEVFNASQLTLPMAGFSFSHLTATTGSAQRSHLARAVLDGVVFAVRANLEQVLEVSAVEPQSVRLCGGLSRSPLLGRALADVLGTTVEVPESADCASLLGAAICAGTAAGQWPDLVQGAQRLVRAGNTYEPDAGRSTEYQGLYDEWQRWRASREASDGLAAEHALRAAAARDVDEPSRVTGPAFQPRILVTASVDEQALDRLRALGPVEYASYRDAQRLLTGDDLVEALRGVHVFVTEVDIVDAEALQQLPDLRAVFSCRANPVNVDVSACTAFGIPVCNAPGRNVAAVAELTVGMMLMLARKVAPAERFLRQPGGEAGDIARMGQAHEKFKGRELGGLCVGLVGLGRVGRDVAALLRPFGVRLLVADPFLPDEQAWAEGAEPVSLEALLEQSDMISLHAPVTDATRGLIGGAQLARMKKGACLVNTARAALVDEVALAEALHSGQLGGAAVDVFAQEPPGADHPLLAMDNLVATPHIAGNTLEVAAHQGRMVAEAVERLVRLQRPETAVNPETLDGFGWTGERRAPSAAELEALAQGGGPAVSDLEVEEEEEPVADPVPRKKGLFSGLKKLVGSGREEDAAAAPATAPAAAPAGGADVSGARAKLEAILADFCERVIADEAIRAFSRSKKVTVRYVLPDVALGFYMSFVGEPVKAALGDSPVKPQVTLKMNAEILDAVFMERIGGMKAAMSGQLSFSGNTMKAMSLQRIQKDLNRLYRDARDAIGDPGDLAALAAPATAPAAAPANASASAAPGRVLIGDERDDLVQAVEELYASRLLTSTGGNVSLRRAGHPDQVWITPSSLPKGGLRPEMMVRVDLLGEPLDDDAMAPSSERLMHCTVFRDRPEVQAVIHSHGPQAITLGMAGLPFLPICTESAFIGDIPRVPFIMPGTDELAEAAVGAIGKRPAVMLLNHGMLVAGSSLRRAIDMTMVVEHTAEVLLGCAAVGKEPPVLPADVVARLRELGEMIA